MREVTPHEIDMLRSMNIDFIAFYENDNND